MTTRRQDPANRKFNQSAFASSVENERGILANLVAARAARLTDAEEITVLWWLQQISWRDGGLEGFAARFLEENAREIATPTMLRIGIEPTRIYSAEQVRAIRAELPRLELLNRFPLRGEHVPCFADFLLDDEDFRTDKSKSENHPTSYQTKDFLSACAWRSAEQFAEYLKQALVDPASDSLRNGRWNFPRLWDALVATRENEIASAGAAIIETEITRQVHEELDYALASRGFVLVEGREGIGKSEAARTWCAKNPGRSVYVRLESGSDETTLYRAIARAIGTACSYARKAVEMRARIQDALQSGHLILVIDEAHFLWPQSERSERTAPKRLDWLRTAIIDHDVPVALISTPQFFERQCDRFRKAGWNANQIQRRLARTIELPEKLSDEDMIAVARGYFPDAAPVEAMRIAAAAQLTVGNLTTIKHLRKRVDFLVGRRSQESKSSLLKIALDEIHMLPAPQQTPPVRADGRAAATPMHAPRARLAQPLCPSVKTPGNRLEKLIASPV